MSDDAAAVPVEVKETVPVVTTMDPLQATKDVLKTALHRNGLARGLREAVKALDRREAHLCVLAKSCEVAEYSKLIIALCDQHQIPYIMVEDGKELGEWAGLCKHDAEGKAVKVVNCSCVVVKSWGGETEARQVILDHLKRA